MACARTSGVGADDRAGLAATSIPKTRINERGSRTVDLQRAALRCHAARPGRSQAYGGFSALVMRYFEGLAAGTRLLGVLPRSGEYESILPMDAFWFRLRQTPR